MDPLPDSLRAMTVGLLAGDIEARCGHLATVPGYPVVMVVDNLLGLGFATG
jgi:hypothetical protein